MRLQVIVFFRPTYWIYWAVNPPSMTNSLPVINEDSSDAKNKAPYAISSAVPVLPIGVDANLLTCRSGADSNSDAIRVSISQW